MLLISPNNLIWFKNPLISFFFSLPKFFHTSSLQFQSELVALQTCCTSVITGLPVLIYCLNLLISGFLFLSLVYTICWNVLYWLPKIQCIRNSFSSPCLSENVFIVLVNLIFWLMVCWDVDFLPVNSETILKTKGLKKKKSVTNTVSFQCYRWKVWCHPNP